MIRAVLLDLDDTLVDHMQAHSATVAAVRDRYPALQQVPLPVLLAESRRVLAALHEDVQLGRVSADNARVERYRQLFAFTGTTGATPHAEAAGYSRDFYQAHRQLVPGADALLSLLAAKARIAVVTNNTTAEQTEKLVNFGLAEHIDALVTSADEGMAKPDARIFAAALARVGVDAAEAVMVGDSLHHDVHAARAAGLHACWLDRTGAATGDEPFVVFSTLTPAATVAARILAH